MKTLICYATRQGTTLKCSKLIASKISNYEMVNINEIKKLDLNSFDQIFIGTPVYFGRINKKIKKLIETNKQLLLQKDLRIFTLGMDDKDLKTTRKNNFDEDILNHALIKYLGGAYNFERMSWWERLIVKKIASVSESYENIIQEKLNEIVI